jgi:hypothetical protein
MHTHTEKHKDEEKYMLGTKAQRDAKAFLDRTGNRKIKEDDSQEKEFHSPCLQEIKNVSGKHSPG